MSGLALAWGAFGGMSFNFGDFLQQLENFGFFQWVLPFLLIFALVYAILEEIPIFKKKKGPAMIVALAVGLLSLQMGFVPAFFQSIFPSFGVGLSILLVALILAGAFITDTDNKYYRWIFFGLGALIFLIVVFSSLSDISFIGNYWFNQYGGVLVVLAIIIGVIVAVVKGTKE